VDSLLLLVVVLLCGVGVVVIWETMEAAINSDHMLPQIRRDSLIRLRVIGGCYESWQERQKMTSPNSTWLVTTGHV